MTHTAIVSALNGLMQSRKDGEYGFLALAERAYSRQLCKFFVDRSADARAQAEVLRQLVIRNGGRPQDGGSVGGALHRGWISLKGMVAVASDEMLLEDAERSEERSLRHYRTADLLNLPHDVAALVRRQHEALLRAYEQIGVMRLRMRVPAS